MVDQATSYGCWLRSIYPYFSGRNSSATASAPRSFDRSTRVRPCGVCNTQTPSSSKLTRKVGAVFASAPSAKVSNASTTNWSRALSSGSRLYRASLFLSGLSTVRNPRKNLRWFRRLALLTSGGQASLEATLSRESSTLSMTAARFSCAKILANFANLTARNCLSSPNSRGFYPLTNCL